MVSPKIGLLGEKDLRRVLKRLTVLRELQWEAVKGMHDAKETIGRAYSDEVALPISTARWIFDQMDGRSEDGFSCDFDPWLQAAEKRFFGRFADVHV